MRTQLQLILKRLKNPSVVISIASQVISILILFNIDLDRTAAVTAVTGVCSVLTLLGIMSNPDSQSKGYSDDIAHCACCDEQTHHVKIGENMVCAKCGCVLDQQPTAGR